MADHQEHIDKFSDIQRHDDLPSPALPPQHPMLMQSRWRVNSTYRKRFSSPAIRKMTAPAYRTAAVWIDQALGCLSEAVCGLDRSSYPAAQCDILGQHLFCAFNRELGPLHALPGVGEFQRQNIGRVVGFHAGHHDCVTHGGPVRSGLVPEFGAGSQ
ncbi:hypothetical protein [Mesorhizobium sp. M7A.F.Ca.US.008.03.1.1]|uniref:hypothetical protein n=1 Tax=Mesorhizobium sp. M7A.F.Ca.US.008.03.1.1 TaxID=2496742 RepID=UPI0013DFE1CD|nr:hypothetical protein [Mesorhizobium sp. M7A.F.Ca.US.008.03.1.1]